MGRVGNDSTITLYLQSTDNFSGVASALLTVSGVTASFMVTTRATNTVPKDFVFSPNFRIGAEPSAFVTATTFISGLDVPTNIILSGTTTEAHYQIFAESTTQTSGMVGNSTITLYLAATSTFNGVATAVLTVGGVSASFVVMTRPDTTPDAFVFSPGV